MGKKFKDMVGELAKATHPPIAPPGVMKELRARIDSGFVPGIMILASELSSIAGYCAAWGMTIDQLAEYVDDRLTKFGP